MACILIYFLVGSVISGTALKRMYKDPIERPRGITEASMWFLMFLPFWPMLVLFKFLDYIDKISRK